MFLTYNLLTAASSDVPCTANSPRVLFDFIRILDADVDVDVSKL